MPAGAGSGVLRDDEAALAAAGEIGFPVLVKPAGGGGGIGMLPARDSGQLLKVLGRARSDGGAELRDRGGLSRAAPSSGRGTSSSRWWPTGTATFATCSNATAPYSAVIRR